MAMMDREMDILRFNFQEAYPVVTRGGEIVIDARGKITESISSGEDCAKEAAKYASVYGFLKEAYEKGNNLEMALLAAARALGIEAKIAEVVGKVPKHWKKV